MYARVERGKGFRVYDPDPVLREMDEIIAGAENGAMEKHRVILATRVRTSFSNTHHFSPMSVLQPQGGCDNHSQS